jgi:hypothetical protein
MKACDSAVVGLLGAGVIDTRAVVVTVEKTCDNTNEREDMSRKTKMCIIWAYRARNSLVMKGVCVAEDGLCMRHP